ncbi:hypothetical protein Tco_0140761 [Tanacetum coccineum]
MTRCHRALRMTIMTQKGIFVFLKNCLIMIPSPSENESFSLDHFDDPSLPRPPPEPPDVEICLGDFINKVVGDISEHDVLMPNLLPTQPTLGPVFDIIDSCFHPVIRGPIRFKPGIFSSPFLSHRAKITFDFSESPMMISGGDIPPLGCPVSPFLTP